MNTRQVKSSASKDAKELNDAILPLWSNSLDNVKLLPGKWVTGTTTSQLKVDSVIEEYSLSLPCDFVRSHPSTIRNCEKSRILWQMKDIPFSGVPFSVVSHHVLKCSFAMNYSSKKRRRISDCDGPELDEDEDDACVEDASLPPRVAVKGLRNCPAKICVKKIKRYPSYSLPTTATKQEKISELQSLKAEMENGARVEEETVYWLGLPLASVHNHAFRGKDRLIHRRVREKILDLVKEGVTSPEVAFRLLREHVTKVFENRNPPRLDDEAYYPSLRNIGHVIYNYSNRKKVGVVNEGVKSEGSQLSSKGRYKNTLQEVVDEFCSDSIGDILETLPNCDPSSAVVDLRNKIQERIGQISQLSQSVNDEKRLSEMLECFDRFLVDSEDRSFNGHTRLVDADSPASFPPKPLKALPLELIPTRNPSSHTLANWSYTKPQAESYLTCIPGSETQSSETNQIVPCPSYEPSHHVTYALMDASPVPYQNILEPEIQHPNCLLPSSSDSSQLPPPPYDSPQLPPIPTAKFVYHIQQLPAIENDSPSYVSL